MAEPARPLPTTSYQFGPYVVEIVSGELRKHGVRLKLQDRPFNLLVALLERSGEVVTREELRQRLWPDGTFVDFDHNISSCINKLRSALNDSPRNPRFIETVGRRGYRFVGVCAPGPPDREFLPDQAPQPATASSLPLRRLAFGVAAVLLIACSAVAGYLAYGKLHPQSPKVRRMMAVLPFKNLTGDETQDYFSDGLTEEMITQLGKLNPQRLGVIGRTSVMHYKESQERLDTIGRELGVDYVLEGSVRRGAGRVRVTAQLIQVSDQTHIWAKDYDQQETDFIRMEDQISDEIADEIQTSLAIPSSASPDASRGTQDYEAYNLYLKGRYFLSKRNPQGLRQAVEYFSEAISKDSNYARAYAGLADSYSLLSSYGFEPASQGVPKARSAALRALAIDDNLAEAHTSLAWIEEQYDHDWQSAEREYHRAIELDPNYATAHQWYGELLGFQGRFDEAITEMEH
ncbi:MAG TPA: winged helix-turn-helix domain-containing protein, partial [Terriglobales bacterium]